MSYSLDLLPQTNKKTIQLLILVLTIATFFGNVSAECLPEPKDLAWLDRTMKVWKSVRRDQLKLKPAKMPWLVLFDENCVFNFDPDDRFFQRLGTKKQTQYLAGKRTTVFSAAHNGKIRLPDSQVIPARLISFAANFDNDKRSFFVAALPSIWSRAEHLQGEKNVPTLVRAVYVHELTHTYHRNFFVRLSQIEKELKDIENFDDDIIQNTFGKDERFRKAYLDEISLANSAAEETNITKKRAAARLLLNAIKQRRNEFYVGEKKKFEEVEDVFLTMEGVANWAGYHAAISDGLDEKTASKLIRRSGKNWSQEEGILLFMIIDPLLPNWQRNAFGSKRVSIVDLLERAVR